MLYAQLINFYEKLIFLETEEIIHVWLLLARWNFIISICKYFWLLKKTLCVKTDSNIDLNQFLFYSIQHYDTHNGEKIN